MRRHADRHVLVTGAGTGIGRAICLRLAAEGAKVSLLGRRAAPLAETVGLADGGDGGGRFFTATCDVRDAAGVRAAVQAAAGALGPIDVAIANAGVGGSNGPGHQEEGTVDRFDDLVATNLGGTYRVFRAALDHLAPEHEDAHGAGSRRHLIAIASILARIGVAGYSGYSASKAGVTGLVRSLATELAPLHVQVNAVAPGWVDTAMARKGIQGMAAGMGISTDEALTLAMEDVPLGRMGRPEEVAGLVSWLISADAQGVTGQTIDVNGGAFMA